jgi:predicted nuclease of predicted toxin-antitoxin system
MRILADENIARDIVAWLRSGEHDVLFAAEASPGTADIRWVEIAEQEQRVILTSDKDFGELVFREGLTSPVTASCCCDSTSCRSRRSWHDSRPSGPSSRRIQPAGSS